MLVSERRVGLRADRSVASISNFGGHSGPPYFCLSKSSFFANVTIQRVTSATDLDSRLRGNDNLISHHRHSREGGNPEIHNPKSKIRNRPPPYLGTAISFNISLITSFTVKPSISNSGRNIKRCSSTGRARVLISSGVIKSRPLMAAWVRAANIKD